jgi:tetratricopeptide (TPR) repeat protein
MSFMTTSETLSMAMAHHSQPSSFIDNQEDWYIRGASLARLGCYEEALASIDEFLASEPSNEAAWIYRGGLLTHLDRYQEALTSFEQALEIQPDNRSACLFRGVALHHLGHYKKANACYNKALGIEQYSIWQKWIRMLKGFLKSDRLGTTVVDGNNSAPTENNLVS